MIRPDQSRAEWRKSTYSSDANCVEVAVNRTVVGVRDSKNSDGPALLFSADIWHTFVSSAR